MTTLLLPYAAWRRNRVWLIGLLRVSMVLVPSHRSSKEGTAVLLHHAATPGLGGMLKDYLRVALGTRVLLQTVAAIILQQPPLAVLLQQCIISAMVSNTSGYCACPLLDNPLAAQRLAWLSRGLDAVPLFTVPFTSAAMLHRQGNPRCICMALLYMHQVVVGVLIPTVLAAYTSSALEEPATPQHRQRQQQQPVWGQLCGLASRAEELWQHANSMVQEVCTGAGMPGVQLALAAWLLAGNLWMIAVAMAERDA
ncbi:TIME FOR COFFEE isoform B [Chlorella sorokiniana]|uniref:TIME FOR COFFEE isoform B n=1 Tax=Chlorella sorokiniana TaxID=3076 RepID=A0A2P6TXM2_CHLSO|nr:TIME FOR COFFEE isoform B [Chlorella sorokiniana]|eukprot:PRW58801.1 TIME FOR COFFEE isoform B [Chlorella sorokiniana]